VTLWRRGRGTLREPGERRAAETTWCPDDEEFDVSNLTVWKFADPDGAEAALATLTDLQKQGLIQVQDGAVVRWDEHRKKPKTTQLHNLTGVGAMSGAFWGMLFGLLFFVPLLGAAMGAAFGAMSGSLADVGIDDRFIEEIRAKVTPGTSALFLLSASGVRDRIAEAFSGTQVELLHTNFSSEEEAKLREVFEA
jgi:uncharacterized membrane protein